MTLPYHVLVKPGGEGWHALDAGRSGSSAMPRHVRHTHVAPGGPGDLEFQVARPTNRRYPDLVPGTPLVGIVAGVPVWAGQLTEADPDGAGIWKVTGKGPVRHLQEDVSADKTFVVADLSKWQSAASFINSQIGLTKLYGDGQVEVGDGSIALTAPSGTALSLGGSVGVTFDAGPNNRIARAVVTYESSFNTPSLQLVVADHTSSDLYAAGSSGNSLVLNNAAGSGTLTKTWVAGTARFIHVYMNTNTATTPGADVWFKITSIQLFTDTAHETANASILKSSQIAGYVFGLGDTDVVSTSIADVATSTTSLPEFYTDGYQSGYDMIQRANDVDRLEWGYTAALKPAPFYRARRTGIADYVANAGDARQVSATGTLGDLYNVARVRWRDSAGSVTVTTVTLSPDTTGLGKLGLSRTAEIDVRRPTNVTVATAIANNFLAEASRLGARKPIRFNGTLPQARGGNSHPAFLRAYDRILLPWEPNTQGAPGKIGSVTACSYDHDAQTVEAEIDTRFTVFDQQLSRFETVGAWGS